MKIRTLLVDASYLLKRSVNGAKDTSTAKFGQIGGLYSFLTTVRKLIKEFKVNKIVLVWDGENGGIMRYCMDSAYKAKRKNKSWTEKIEMTDIEIKRENEKDESILKQRKRIQAYVEELFIRQIEVDDIEGDDIIASYCLRYNQKEEIFLFTNDRDFSQLLDLDITIKFSNIDQPITRGNYFFHFNHHYTNALMLKILTGDKGDGVEGIRGLGEKILLEHFPDLKFKTFTVRDICKGADEINKQRVIDKKKPLKVFETLLNNIDRLKLNFQLVNLREPLLNEQAIEELEQLDLPLSPENRGSKNLYNMMMEDEFLSVYGSTFVQYIEPFYSVIMNEKQLLNEYYKNNKGKS